MTCKPTWRSLLYVPANNARFLAKAGERGADGVILDLEDSVPVAQKPKARQALADTIAALHGAPCDILVRVNAPLRLLVRDIEAAVVPGVAALFLPKVESAAALRMFDALVSDLEVERGLPPGAIRFVPMIETARGVMDADAIAQATPRNVAMVLGGEDLATELGLVPDAETLRHPKLRVLMAAKAAGLSALGLLETVADFADADRVRRSAEQAVRFGFDGASCVHPILVSTLNTAFSPSDEQLGWARGVVAEMKRAEDDGQGASMFDGRMIDAPMLTRARAILARDAAVRGRTAVRSDEF